jgi:tetratricopeptide (TPR) repeat protein
MKNVTGPLVLGFALLGLCASAAHAQSGDTAYNIAFSDARNTVMKNRTGEAAIDESALGDYRNADELLGQAILEDEENRKAKLLQKAMKRAERVVREAEEWPDAWRLVARIAFRMEDWETCRSGFERAAELYADESQISDAQINARWCGDRVQQPGS